MKIARLALGIVIICAALWVIIGEQISGASADAVVNAQLSTLRTGIAGTLSLEQRTLGARVAKGEDLGAIVDPLVDSGRLNDLFQERDLAKAEAARLASLIASTEATMAARDLHAKAARAERIADLQIRLDNARVRFGLLTGNADGGALAVALAGDESQGDPRLPALALNYAAERVNLLDLQLSAEKTSAEADDANLRATLDGLKAEATAVAARQETIANRVKAEQLRTNRLGARTLSSTVNGVIWEFLASDDETLQRGQDVMRFVDCDSTIVTASVAENVYRQLTSGQSATFRMTGEDMAYPATVTRLAGAGAASIYRNLAVAPSPRHLERFDVTLLVPALRDIADKRCAIGRTGRVFFDTRPLDWLRGLWH